MFKLLDRLTEPGSPFVLRFMLACFAALFLYGVLGEFVALSAAWGCGFMAYSLWEDRSKLLREQRLAAHRAERDLWERRLRAAWQMRRLEFLITPDWVY